MLFIGSIIQIKINFKHLTHQNILFTYIFLHGDRDSGSFGSPFQFLDSLLQRLIYLFHFVQFAVQPGNFAFIQLVLFFFRSVLISCSEAPCFSRHRSISSWKASRSSRSRGTSCSCFASHPILPSWKESLSFAQSSRNLTDSDSSSNGLNSLMSSWWKGCGVYRLLPTIS